MTTQLNTSATSVAIHSEADISVQYRNLAEDKEQLEELNLELATYIQSVKDLRARNAMLEQRIQILQQTNINISSGTDLSAQLKALQEEKSALLVKIADLELTIQASQDKIKELEDALAANTRTLNTTKTKLQAAESRASRAENDAHAAHSLAAEKVSEIEVLQGTIKDLEKKLAHSDASLRAERLANVTAKSKVEGLLQEIEILKSKHHQEIEYYNGVIVKIDGAEQSANASGLVEGIAEAKRHYKLAVDNFRKQIKAYFEQQPIVQPDDAAIVVRKQLETELATVRLEFEQYVASNVVNDAEIASLKQQLTALQKAMVAAQERNATILSSKEEFIYKLTKTIQDKDNLYRDLLDQTIALNSEIDYYRKLLSTEVMRNTNILSPSRVVSTIVGAAHAVSQEMVRNASSSTTTSVTLSSSSSSSSKRHAVPQLDLSDSDTAPAEKKAKKGGKKKKGSANGGLVVEANAQGSLAIDDVDHKNGTCVVVKNTSADTLDLNGWAITATNKETHLGTFVFEGTTLGAGESLTVYSQSAKKIPAGAIVWDEFPAITGVAFVSFYTFDPEDKEASTYAIQRS